MLPTGALLAILALTSPSSAAEQQVDGADDERYALQEAEPDAPVSEVPS